MRRKCIELLEKEKKEREDADIEKMYRTFGEGKEREGRC